MTGVPGIDHVVIVVRALDDAYRAMVRLGFAPTPRGAHPLLDTANHTIMFADGTYFEVLAVTRAGARNAAYADFVRQREGVAAIAVKADDARAVQQRFAGPPLHAAEALDFARPVDMPDGHREARFTVTQLDPFATAGARVFACQHHTPELVWRRDMLSHPNGVLGLDDVVLVVKDPVEDAHAYETMFDAKAVRSRVTVDIATGTCTLKLATPAAAAALFPDDPLLRLAPPYCAALGFKVVDRNATDRALRSRGVATASARGGAIVVSSAEACGTILAFR